MAKPGLYANIHAKRKRIAAGGEKNESLVLKDTHGCKHKRSAKTAKK